VNRSGMIIKEEFWCFHISPHWKKIVRRHNSPSTCRIPKCTLFRPQYGTFSFRFSLVVNIPRTILTEFQNASYCTRGKLAGTVPYDPYILIPSSSLDIFNLLGLVRPWKQFLV